MCPSSVLTFIHLFIKSYYQSTKENMESASLNTVRDATELSADESYEPCHVRRAANEAHRRKYPELDVMCVLCCTNQIHSTVFCSWCWSHSAHWPLIRLLHSRSQHRHQLQHRTRGNFTRCCVAVACRAGSRPLRSLIFHDHLEGPY